MGCCVLLERTDGGMVIIKLPLPKLHLKHQLDHRSWLVSNSCWILIMVEAGC